MIYNEATAECTHWDTLPVDVKRETGSIQYHFNSVTFERYTQLGGCHAKLNDRVRELAEQWRIGQRFNRDWYHEARCCRDIAVIQAHILAHDRRDMSAEEAFEIARDILANRV